MSNDGTDDAQLAAVTVAVATLEEMSAKVPEYVKRCSLVRVAHKRV